MKVPPAVSGYFVTGTDTGVGKTLLACVLLRTFSAHGIRAVGMKPVASGATSGDDGLVNDDVLALEAASNVTAPRELTNPYCFKPAIAPHIAAHEAGVTISLTRLRSAYQELTRRADCVVVEEVARTGTEVVERCDPSTIWHDQTNVILLVTLAV